jgi:thiol-disulfide isomerase/thioredoxin
MKKTTMKRIAFAAMVAGSSAVAAAPAGNPDAALGSHALKGLDGTTTTLAAYRGELVVVNFWASWCAPCRMELPVLDAWNRAWAGRGARVVAISIDQDARKAKRFVDEMELSLAVMHDGPAGLARTLDIPTVPYTVLLDRDGRVIGEVRGSAEDEVAEIRRRVETLLASGTAKPVQEAGMSGGTR